MEEIIKFNAITMKAIGKDGDMYSLNDLWKMLGSPKSMEPKFWKRLPDTERYLDSESNTQKVRKSHLLRIKKGRGGGTYATQRVFLEYARYLNKDLAVQINEVFLQEIKAQQNPELYLDKARAAYKRKGKGDEWVDKRFKGISTRNALTHTLSHHGCKTGKDFSRCTKASYEGLFGRSVPALREALNITEKQSIRDNMSSTQLIILELSEDLAKKKIEGKNINGAKNCADTCRDASQAISQAVQNFLK